MHECNFVLCNFGAWDEAILGCKHITRNCAGEMNERTQRLVVFFVFFLHSQVFSPLSQFQANSVKQHIFQDVLVICRLLYAAADAAHFPHLISRLPHPLPHLIFSV